ncbi:unnamed protein product, partial [Rotaria sp. Silwood2]
MSKTTKASKQISYLTDKQCSTLDTENLKSDTQVDDIVLQIKRSTYSFKVLASLILWTHSSKFDYNKLHASNNDSPEIDQLTNAVSDDDINVEESYSYVDIKSQESSSNIDNKLEKSYSNVVEKQRD